MFVYFVHVYNSFNYIRKELYYIITVNSYSLYILSFLRLPVGYYSTPITNISFSPIFTHILLKFQLKIFNFVSFLDFLSY